jgi:hypothetical protein
MPYEIVLAPEAIEHIEALKAAIGASVRAAPGYAET